MKLIFTFLLMCLVYTSAFARNIQDIKAQIFKTAQSFMGQTDVDGSKKKQIEKLVKELLENVPPLTMEQKAINALGVWNQVWGPYAFDDSSRLPRGIDPAQIYQYISADGFYYNFGEYNLGLNLKFFVKGKYQILENKIAVEFTRHGLVPQKQVDYATLGDDIESQSVKVIPFPSQLPPVGIKGALVEVYADEDLRINYGAQGDDLSDMAIFVMRRVR
jgi:hypothetical protein